MVIGVAETKFGGGIGFHVGWVCLENAGLSGLMAAFLGVGKLGFWGVS